MRCPSDLHTLEEIGRLHARAFVAQLSHIDAADLDAFADHVADRLLACVNSALGEMLGPLNVTPNQQTISDVQLAALDAFDREARRLWDALALSEIDARSSQ